MVRSAKTEILPQVSIPGGQAEGAPASSDRADVIAQAAGDLSASSAAELRQLLEAIDKDQAETLAGIAVAEGAVDTLLATDEELEAQDLKVRRLGRRRRRLDIASERVRAGLIEVEQIEAETARVDRYRSARTRIAEAEEWTRHDYATHAQAISDGLVRLGEVDALLDEVNADRPAGTPQLELEVFRALPPTADTSTVRSETYYVDEQGEERRSNSDQIIWKDDQGQFRFGTSQNFIKVFARTRDVPQQLPGRPLVMPRKLAAAVHLPGVEYADTDFWPRRSKAWGA